MIIFIGRKSYSGQYSIHKIFSVISAYIKASSYYILPFHSSFLGIIGNMLYVMQLRFIFNKRVIFHITGDVHYLMLVMPRRRTVLTIHDLYGVRNLKGLKRIYFNILWIFVPLVLSKTIVVPSELVKRQISFILIKYSISNRVRIIVIENPLLYV